MSWKWHDLPACSGRDIHMGVWPGVYVVLDGQPDEAWRAPSRTRRHEPLPFQLILGRFARLRRDLRP